MGFTTPGRIDLESNWHWQNGWAVKIQAKLLARSTHTAESLRKEERPKSISITVPCHGQKDLQSWFIPRTFQAYPRPMKNTSQSTEGKINIPFLAPLGYLSGESWESAHMSALKTLQFFPFVFLSLLVPPKGHTEISHVLRLITPPHYYTVLLDS